LVGVLSVACLLLIVACGKCIRIIDSRQRQWSQVLVDFCSDFDGQLQELRNGLFAMNMREYRCEVEAATNKQNCQEV